MVLLRLLAFKPQEKALPSEAIKPVHIDFPEQDLSVQSTVTETINKPEIENKEIDNREFETNELESADINESLKPSSAELNEELNAELLAIEKEAEQVLNQAESTEITEPAQVSEPSEPIVNNDQITVSESINNEIESVPQPEVEAQSQQPLENAPSQVVDEQVQQAPVTNSPIDSILASRNMLRSRKKQLENNGKKSNDAEERLEKKLEPVKFEKRDDVPDLETLPSEPFQSETIDPSIVKKANQVDRWANIIDSMALNGRLRQLALNAIISKDSTDDSFILELNQSTKHLKSPVALEQLQQFVCQYFEKEMQVEIVVVEETQDDPFQIQEQINDKRYDYAKDLLKTDEIVIGLEQAFQAELDEKSISAR